MRLVCTIIKDTNSNENPYAFSALLENAGIANECEEVVVPGEEPHYRIWVIEEDQFEKARELYTYYKHHPQEIEAPTLMSAKKETTPPPENRAGKLSPAPFRFFSTCIIALAIGIFLLSQITGGVSVPPKLKGVPTAPVLKGINKLLAFDYPHYFELRDELVALLPKDAKEGEPLSASAISVLLKMKETPFWDGIYERFIRYIHKEGPLSYTGPMFEKISQGEVWRLVTPALLHYDFLHILFNLLWFVMLSHQIESKIGSIRFIILFLLTAILSNVSQYLMSGSFFMGLSGVVVGLAAFIWARQQVAPWEGYLLQRMTLLFLGLFVLGIFALQLFFFFLQITGNGTLNIPIANTAHLVGGITGYLLGRMPLFKLRHSAV